MTDILNKKLTLSKKGTDGKFQAVAWIQKSDKYDTLSCSISVERMKELLATAQGKYVYCSVFVDDADSSAQKSSIMPEREPAKAEPEIQPVDDTIPF